MKLLAILGLLIASQMVHAKSLSVQCQNTNPETYPTRLEMAYEVSETGGTEITKMILNGSDQMKSYQNVSRTPSYKQGQWTLATRFSVILASHLDINLEGCDATSSSGAGYGVLDMYVGQPKQSVPLTCACELKP